MALGFFLIWYFYKDLTEEDKNNIVTSFEQANYWWIGLSTLIAVLSHVFRAYRWKYTLEPVGIRINLANRFAAVMVGYLANLAFPRLGEVSRCAVLTQHQKQPFEKLFGTVIAERMVDALILLLIMGLTLVLQLPVLEGLIMDAVRPIMDKVQNQLLLLSLAVVGGIAAFVTWQFIRKSGHKVAVAIRNKVLGLWEGIKSLKDMENQRGFYLHTFLIWLSYVGMFWVTFQAFPETAEVPFGGVLASFTMGGLTIVAVQGGLGAYPLGVMSVLLLYGINKDLGYAFGWIVWFAQTAMILVVGFLSLLAMPLINTNEANEPATT